MCLIGLFYVIDGHLDISMPQEDAREPTAMPRGTQDEGTPRYSMSPAPSFAKQGGPSSIDYLRQNEARKAANKDRKHLFTVKPGGIAGYLGKVQSFKNLPIVSYPVHSVVVWYGVIC